MQFTPLKVNLTIRYAQKNGFALISALIIMLLLMVIALATLSLSSTTTRETSVSSNLAEAKANARMALMLAIGKLQTHTGLDTRITAPAEIIEAGAPPLTGAWRSWEGDNHDMDTGRPISPDYLSKTKTNGSGKGRFLAWLVSGAESGDPETIPTPSDIVFTSSTGNSVPLLSFGTLGSNLGQVHVTPQMINGDSGAIGWWVSPENQKARLLHAYNPRTNDSAGWADLAKTHAVPDPDPFGLDASLDDPESHTPSSSDTVTTRKAITLDTTEFLADENPDKPQQSFHDLSTSAMGLLTNTATGGWRKDMSILSEKWDDIYASYSNGELPLFRYSTASGSTSLAQKPTTDNYDVSQSNFYPWSGYTRFGANRYPLTYNSASSSWQSLVNFATRYKSIDFKNTTKTASSPIGWKHNVSERDFRYSFQNQDFYNHYHKSELNPVLARTQLIIQANAIPDLDPNNLLSNPKLYHRINLRVVPIFTLWNPYNVEIIKTANDPEFGIGTVRSLPLALSIINGTVRPDGKDSPEAHEGHYKLINDGKSAGIDGDNGVVDQQLPDNYSSQPYYHGGVQVMSAWLPREFTLKPGEVKVFSPQADSNVGPRGIIYYYSMLLKEGYDVGNDFGMPLANPDNLPQAVSGGWGQQLANRFVKVPGRADKQLHISDQVNFSVKADRLSKIFTNSVTPKNGVGNIFAIGTHHSPHASGGRTANETGKANLVANRFQSLQAMNIDREWAQDYWPTEELEELTYSVSELIPGGGNPPWTDLFTVSFGPRLTFGAAAGSVQNRPTKGLLQSSPFVNNAFSIPEQTAANHPVNSAYDISYHSMSINSNLTPETGLSGYIATGFQAGDGLSRLIMAEIPLTPMASLVELQHWNLRGNNPLPPYQYNLIGNSDATPLITQDSVLPEIPVTGIVSNNLQHDDAYCGNHLLFDDWILSSIAPQPTTFGSSIARDIETVYRDFLQGNARLTNRAYKPIAEDQKLSSTDATKKMNDILNSPAGEGWLKVASRLEVEGMFNVNSTSVKAWRAILGHARQQQVAYHAANGIDLDTTQHEHIVSRHTIASDIKAGADSGVGAIFPSGSEYAGFKTLSYKPRDGEGDVDNEGNVYQLDELSEKIVEQVRKRGPFLSLSEFVNRQLTDDEGLALSGAIQSALDSLSNDPNKVLKDPANQLSSVTMNPNPDDALDKKLNGAGYAFDKASEGMSTHGFPGWIRQADILRPIAPIISVRDDTFTIRAYGDYRDELGNVVARAWCEATVQRKRSYVNPGDAADSIDPPTNAQNTKFGRRYEIVSFRWLSEDEV